VQVGARIGADSKRTRAARAAARVEILEDRYGRSSPVINDAGPDEGSARDARRSHHRGRDLDPERRALFEGVELADSITIDPHKWLAVPMGAGLYLARDWTPLEDAFRVSTGYMPVGSSQRRDSYTHSVQWSRRFIGAKVFMALATMGLAGYRKMIGKQFDLANHLRDRLGAHGWTIRNRTDLPLVCFDDNDDEGEVTRAIERTLVEGGEFWIPTVRLRGRLSLRACITSFETDAHDVDALVAALDGARVTARARIS